MRLVTKIHKTYTLCVLYVLRGEFLQWTQQFIKKTYLLPADTLPGMSQNC